jgi:hypothetical protein
MRRVKRALLSKKFLGRNSNRGDPAQMWMGHGSEEMIRRFTHLRADFMRDELRRVPRFAPKTVSNFAEIPPVAPQLAVAV